MVIPRYSINHKPGDFEDDTEGKFVLFEDIKEHYVSKEKIERFIHELTDRTFMINGHVVDLDFKTDIKILKALMKESI